MRRGDVQRLQVETAERISRARRAGDMITLTVVTRKMAVLVRVAAKIAENSAGICDECGDRIEPARLAALEGCATHCIGCAKELERREGGDFVKIGPIAIEDFVN